MEAGGSEVQNQPWMHNDFKVSPRRPHLKKWAVNSLNLNWAMFMSSWERNLARIKSMDWIHFLPNMKRMRSWLWQAADTEGQHSIFPFKITLCSPVCHCLCFNCHTHDCSDLMKIPELPPAPQSVFTGCCSCLVHFFKCLFVEVGAHCAALADLEVTKTGLEFIESHLPLPPKQWD